MAHMSHASPRRASVARRPVIAALGRGPVLALVLAVVIARSARAEETGAQGKQRVAVVRLAFEGAVPEAARELFAQRLALGLAAARFEVMTGAIVRRTHGGSGRFAVRALSRAASHARPRLSPQWHRQLRVLGR